MIFRLMDPIPGFDNTPHWGAQEGEYTFVVSQPFAGTFIASAKHVTATPFDGGRHDLGFYDSLEDAQEACENFLNRVN